MTAGRDLGFAGLVAAGGRAALDCARAAWARHGLPAPFDNLPEQPGATP